MLVVELLVFGCWLLLACSCGVLLFGVSVICGFLNGRVVSRFVFFVFCGWLFDELLGSWLLDLLVLSLFWIVCFLCGFLGLFCLSLCLCLLAWRCCLLL